MDFGEDVCFGDDFSFLPELDMDFFEESSLGVDSFTYDDVSISHLVESIVLFCLPKKKRQKQKQRSPNCTRYRASVRTLCWYKNYLELGLVCEATHELFMSDRYGKICHWFQMPLYKVEELTTLLMSRDCIREPRTHWQMLAFRDCTELLVILSVYILGHGAYFFSLRPLCHMSKSDCTKFSTYSLTRWMTCTMSSFACQKIGLSCCQLWKVTKNRAYQDVVGQWMLFTCSGCSVPIGDMNRGKGKETVPTLAFECVTHFNWQIMGLYWPHFGSPNDKEIVKSNPTMLEVTLG